MVRSQGRNVFALYMVTIQGRTCLLSIMVKIQGRNVFALYKDTIQGRTCLLFTWLRYKEGRVCSLQGYDTRKERVCS